MTTSPAMDLINISSSSREEFAVEPFSLTELDERFRAAPIPLTDIPLAFMGAAGAMLISYYVESWNEGE